MDGSCDCLRDFCVFGDAYWTKYCANCRSNQNDLNSRGREKLALSIGLTVDLRGKQGSWPANTNSYNYLKLLVGVRRFELPAPASRRQLGVYMLLLLIDMLETPADVSA